MKKKQTLQQQNIKNKVQLEQKSSNKTSTTRSNR